jgi:bacterioferritin-associated ferredoxin
MYVCVCKVVTDVEIHRAIDQGACTTADIARACRGAGGDCGGCRGHIERMLDERRVCLPIIDEAAE